MSRSPATGHGRLLDVGSARGDSSAEISDRFSTCIALDISGAVLKDLVSAGRAGALLPLQGDAEHLPFPDGAFDCIRLREVLEHVDDPAAVVAESSRCLRDGGRLDVTVPTGYSERVYWRLHPDYQAQSTHKRIFEHSELVEMLEAAGIEVKTTSTYFFAPMIAWFIHCLLRTPADHTGKVLEHQWVDRAVQVVVGGLRRAPLVGPVIRHLATRYGKSWGFDGIKVPSLR